MPSRKKIDGEADGRHELHADPVGAAQAAGIAGPLQFRVDALDHAAFLAATGTSQALDHGSNHALVERLLELHLLDGARLDHELREACLDGILGSGAPRRRR